ncbi:MAG: tetratricopeptide repeat protein [Bacteroidaceae bacterium]
MKTYSKVAFVCLCALFHTAVLCGAKAPKWLKKARQAQVTVIVFDNAGNPREAQGVVMGDSGVVVTEYDVMRGGVRADVVNPQGETFAVHRILGANSMYNVCKLQLAQYGKMKGLSMASTPAQPRTEVYILPTSKADKNVPCTTDTVAKDESFRDRFHYYTLSSPAPERLAGCPVMNAEGYVVGLLQMAVQEGKPSYVIDAAYPMSLCVQAIDAGNDDLQALPIPKALPQSATDAASYIYLAGTRDSARYRQLTDDFILAWPDSATGYVMQAEWLAGQGHHEQAQAVYDQGLEKAKARADELHYSLSRMIYASCVDGASTPYGPWTVERALAEAQAADSLRPLSIYTKQQADCLYALKRYAEAQDRYLALTHTNLRSPEMFVYASLCLQRQEGEHADSIVALLDSAVAFYAQPLPREAAPVVLMRASALEKAGRKREAVADYNTYEHLNGGNMTANFYYTREQLEVACRMYPAALNDIERAVRLSPDDAVLRAEQAALNYRVGQVEEAVEAAREAIRIDPEMPDSYRILGVCLRQQGKKAEAKEQLQKAADLGDTIAKGMLEKEE